MSRVRYLIGDVRARLRDLPADSVDLVVTSWPYWLQRAYLPDDHPNKQYEIGQEPTVAEFIDTLLDVTAEIDRVLAPHGSIAMELADTFSGNGGAGGDYQTGGLRDGQPTWTGSAAKSRHGVDHADRREAAARVNGSRDGRLDEYAGIVPRRDRRKHDGIDGVIPPDKSLCMIPELFRIALAYGINPLTGRPSPAGMWRCRNVVLHCRPNPSPGADADKYRPAKSDWVIATHARDRYWDGYAVRVPASPNTHAKMAKGTGSKPKTQTKGFAAEDNRHSMVELETTGETSPLKDHWWEDDPRLDRFDQEAWHLSTHGYKGAHFATFSPKLIAPFILAMTPERVCTTCGEPSRRITDRLNAVGAATRRNRAHTSDRPEDLVSTEVPDSTDLVHVGWSECDCDGDDRWRNGVVLDPFGGSGTTGMVASGNGRDAVLIDFDDRNLDLARERCGMFLEIDDPAEALT